MVKDWGAYAEASNGLYTVEQFKDAAYQLLCSQVLYENERAQRVAYGVVNSHRSAYAELLGYFGMRLRHSEDFRFVCAVPEGDKQPPISLMDTLFVLVLRKLWHDRALQADLKDGGVASVTIEETQEAFRAATGRELDDKSSELRERVSRAKRFGIARDVRATEGDQPFTIDILPGIIEIVSEGALAKLVLHQQAENAKARSDTALAGTPSTEESDEAP